MNEVVCRGEDEKKYNDLLKSISRSLYLTFILLPKAQRYPITLAFLIAKAGDNIVDAYQVDVQERVIAYEELERAFRVVVDQHEVDVNVSLLEIDYDDSEEACLATKLEMLFYYLLDLSDAEIGLIDVVISSIFEKQKEELLQLKIIGVYANEDLAGLDDYVHKMSGVVGEFWTNISYKENAYSSLGKDELNELGVAYGKSLHCLNILRDIRKDVGNGRFYIPVHGEVTARKVFEEGREMVGEIRSGLEDGLRYGRSLKSVRLKMAVVLPARLGLRYLAKYEQVTWEDYQNTKLLSRWDVYKQLIQGMIIK